MIYIRSQDGTMLTTFSTLHLAPHENGYCIKVCEDGKSYIVASYTDYQVAYREIDTIHKKIATSVGSNIPRSTDIVHYMSPDT